MQFTPMPVNDISIQPTPIVGGSAIACTCKLVNPADSGAGTIYDPLEINDYALGETRTVKLKFQLRRMENGCKAAVHDEPVYRYSLLEWRAMGLPATGETISQNTVAGDILTIKECGKYTIMFHTRYHGEGYGGNYALDVYGYF